MKLNGHALKYEEDNINTDVIWPGKYTYVQMPPEEMKNHALENFDENFKEKVQTKTIMVVGKNFGCGSSREQAAECLKHSGVKAVIAKSFARIYYRNALNVGLPVIESDEAVTKIKEGDTIDIDLEKGTITINNDTQHTISIATYPEFVTNLIREGGLINAIKKKLEQKK